MGFQYNRAPPQIKGILYPPLDTLWHQRITNCFGWEKDPCPNALSAQANDHKPDHNKRLSFCWGEADHSADRESVYNAHSSHRCCRSTQVIAGQLLWHKSGVHLWRRGLLGQLGVEPLAHGNSTGHHFHSTDHLHLEIAKSSPPHTHPPSAH